VTPTTPVRWGDADDAGAVGRLSTTAVHVGNMSRPGTSSASSAIASLHWNPTTSRMIAAVIASSATSTGEAAPSATAGKKAHCTASDRNASATATRHLRTLIGRRPDRTALAAPLLSVRASVIT
jgi:hypothetical protein